MPRTGTQYASMLEWALAARWWGMDWAAFCDADGMDQSFLVAVYRTAMQIEAVEAFVRSKKK